MSGSSYNGRVMGAANIPSFSVASGIWRPNFIASQLRGVSVGKRFPPSKQDPSFSSVDVLLHFDDIGDFNHSGGMITDYSSHHRSCSYTCPIGFDGGFQDTSVLHSGFGAATVNIGNGASSSDIRGVQANGNTLWGTSDVTLEFWMQFSALNGVNVWDARTVATVGPAIFVASTGAIEYDVNNTAKITSSTGVIVGGNGHWYHIAYCRSGTSGKLFVDGTQVGSTYTDNNNYSAAGTLMSSTHHIGNNFNHTAGMKGYLAEYRVTVGVARYTANFTPTTVRFPDY